MTNIKEEVKLSVCKKCGSDMGCSHTKEEFDLSEKIIEGLDGYVPVKDVKEFIRLLKKNVAEVENAVWMHELDIFYKEIDKLAGEKLCQ